MKIRTVFIDAGNDGRTYAQIIGKPSWVSVVVVAGIAMLLIGVLIVNLWPVP
jgi:hypothetical protein